MSMGNYILNAKGEPVPEDDIVAWAKWFEKAKRQIARTTIREAFVSTVFLGIDHQFLPDGPPLLWETMIFGGKHDGYQDRYATQKDALKGHEEACKLVRDDG